MYMKYYLIGPLPPKIGGISVFIYRYTKILQQKGYVVVNIDRTKMSTIQKFYFYIQILLYPSKNIFHLNGPEFLIMFLLLVRLFPSKIIYNDHSGRIVEKFSGLRRLIFRFFLKKVDECVFVGEHLKKYYIQSQIELPEKMVIQNAFIPPPEEDEEKIWGTYSIPAIHLFVESKKPLVIANAFQIVFYQGVDLYGLDMCVELISRLKNKYPNIGLIFALAEVNDKNYFEKITNEIEMKGLRDNIHFLTGQKELWPLFKKADLMVRPTYNDGYGISIAEALYFGCPAVASDVCVRPEKTILFTNRNIDDLEEKAMAVLIKNGNFESF